MYKAMILLKRKESMSIDGFRNWWLQQHASLAKQLPGLRKAVFNLADGDGGGMYDGVSELWFDSKADFEDAYASAIGIQVTADSIANVSKRERLIVNETVVRD